MNNEAATSQMNKLITGYITFCCKLENENKGLTNAFMKDESYKEMRALEKLGEIAYNQYDYIREVQIINALRMLWIRAVKDFQEGKFNNMELFKC